MRCAKIAGLVTVSILFVFAMGWAQWEEHNVRQLNGRGAQIKLPAKFQTVSEGWNRIAQMPYLIYMPEKDRLLMLVLCDRPSRAFLLSSPDRGATWSAPRHMHVDAEGKPDTDGAVSLTYLGNGKAMLVAGNKEGEWNWFSHDFGETWHPTERPVAAPGKPFYSWDPFFVDRDPKTDKIVRLVETGYMRAGASWEEGGSSQGLIRFSPDEGQTWGNATVVPQWLEWNEIGLVRAKNGDLVAACRSDGPKRFFKLHYDNYSGLGVSISKDNGQTWSNLNVLYQWGRHHASLVLLPSGDLVMTYVVRRGYPDTPEGYPQMGVEAVVSHDNGQTWDLDHRYILATWRGLVRGPDGPYVAQSQSTSSVLLPDGSILTTYGSAHRALRNPANLGSPAPRDIGLVQWRVNQGQVNSDRTMASAPPDSDLRNKFDPHPPAKGSAQQAAVVAKNNIAVVEAAARVTASPRDQDPGRILHDPYVSNVVTLQTMPAWVEISWPKPHRIDEIRIHPGAPAIAGQPSTECVPLDYRLQYQKGQEWVDLIPPITNAKRYQDFDKQLRIPYVLDKEFEYVHKFPPIAVKAIRMYVTRSSDPGKRIGSGDKVVIPEERRETVLREIEVFEAQ